MIDGEVRRHVINPASLAAWHFTNVVKTPAAQVYASAQGPDLPATPFLVQGSGPAIWVVDVSPSTAPTPPMGGDGGTADGGGGGGGGGGSGGCTMQPFSRGSSGGFAPLGLALAIIVVTRRRKRAC